MTGLLFLQMLCIVGAIAAAVSLLVEAARGRVRPARLLPDGSSAFTAPWVPGVMLRQVLLLTLGGANSALMVWSTIGGDGGAAQATAMTLCWLAVAVCAVATARMVFIWQFGSAIALTTAGVRVGGWRLYRWKALAEAPTLPFWLPLAGSPPGRGSISAMDADPRFVYAAIDYYRRHPDRWEAIGRLDEYMRLEDDLGGRDS